MTKPHKSQPRKRPRAPRAMQRPDAIAFTVEGFQALGGPGKTKIYELRLDALQGRDRPDIDQWRLRARVSERQGSHRLTQNAAC